jgi:hypothetical protein
VKKCHGEKLAFAMLPLQDTICPLLIEVTYWYNGSF